MISRNKIGICVCVGVQKRGKKGNTQRMNAPLKVCILFVWVCHDTHICSIETFFILSPRVFLVGPIWCHLTYLLPYIIIGFNIFQGFFILFFKALKEIRPLKYLCSYLFYCKALKYIIYMIELKSLYLHVQFVLI